MYRPIAETAEELIMGRPFCIRALVSDLDEI